MLLLPVIKNGFKFIVAKMYQHDEDLVISTTASVDIFDAMYMTKYMQSGSTLIVGFGIIALDVAQNHVAIAMLSKQSRKVRLILASSTRLFINHQHQANDNQQLEVHHLQQVFPRSAALKHVQYLYLWKRASSSSLYSCSLALSRQ